MKPAKISVLYNKDFGYIIASETKIKGTIINTIIDPVISLQAQISAEKLGDVIFQGIKASEHATPMNEDVVEKYKYWQISGIKNFRTFSQKFQNIKITKNEDNYSIYKMKTSDKGGYMKDKNNPACDYSLSISADELGKIIFELMNPKQINYSNLFTFNTIHNNEVTYERPSDDFNDIGDGHTDAYQIYTLDGDDNTYIAFMIDSGYTSFSAVDIEKKWKQWYPDLREFKYQSQQDSNISFIVSATSGVQKVTSYFYKDGDSYLEVMTQIAVNRIIEGELKKVISSIKIKD